MWPASAQALPSQPARALPPCRVPPRRSFQAASVRARRHLRKLVPATAGQSSCEWAIAHAVMATRRLRFSGRLEIQSSVPIGFLLDLEGKVPREVPPSAVLDSQVDRLHDEAVVVRHGLRHILRELLQCLLATDPLMTRPAAISSAQGSAGGPPGGFRPWPCPRECRSL